MRTVLNIAGYRFVHLADLAAWRERLYAAALAHELRGTILLAEEGINLCLAGHAAGVEAFLAQLRDEREFTDLVVKTSWSGTQPFRRLRVRLRAEIIRMNQPLIRPQAGRAPAVDAKTLKRWLDQGSDDAGRPLLLLDTRNDYEVDAGRFAGAMDLRLGCFSEFPGAVAARREALQGRAIVSYCTGGIRCEKAALYLSAIGVTDHWQLEGGILKYFELIGGAHYEGACVVFDERGALTPALEPAP